MDEESQKVKTFSYKLSSRNLMYRIVTIVNNTIHYCTFESC